MVRQSPSFGPCEDTRGSSSRHDARNRRRPNVVISTTTSRNDSVTEDHARVPSTGTLEPPSPDLIVTAALPHFATSLCHNLTVYFNSFSVKPFVAFCYNFDGESVLPRDFVASSGLPCGTPPPDRGSAIAPANDRSISRAAEELSSPEYFFFDEVSPASNTNS